MRERPAKRRTREQVGPGGTLVILLTPRDRELLRRVSARVGYSTSRALRTAITDWCDRLQPGEPIVIEHLEDEELAAPVRRSLWEALGSRRREANDPDAIGRIAMKDLGRGDDRIRDNVLVALSELRRQLEGTSAAFDDEATARAWWEAR